MSMSVQKSQVHKTTTKSQDDDKRLCLVDDLKEVQVHIQVKLIGTRSSQKSKITTSYSQDEVKKTNIIIGKKVAYRLLEKYVLNAWKKFGVKRSMEDKRGFVFIKFSFEGVLGDGPCLIHSVPFILRKWKLAAELSQDELTSAPVWVKLHGVHALAFTADGLSDIATRFGTPMMLDSCTVTASATSHDGFQTGYRKVFRGPVIREQEVLGDLEDDGPLDARSPKHDLEGTHTEENLVENGTKNKKAPRKTGIWLGRNAKSSLESDFASPNHFDLPTKEYGKTILLNL
ncbi:zinc knuckle CX2CX4HX4C containing protein [Tanacetum coccineum]